MGRVKRSLSKSGLWRVDILKILVTIGSMKEKKFTRLFNIIDELCEEKIIDGKNVIAQVGFDNYNSNNFNTFDMIDDYEFKKMIDDSDVIITHAGTGTVISCIKKGKKVIIFPRLVEYNEHYDNHQLELCELFKRKNYALIAKNREELIKCINSINEFNPKKFISNNKNINKLIIDFINK